MKEEMVIDAHKWIRTDNVRFVNRTNEKIKIKINTGSIITVEVERFKEV